MRPRPCQPSCLGYRGTMISHQLQYVDEHHCVRNARAQGRARRIPDLELSRGGGREQMAPLPRVPDRHLRRVDPDQGSAAALGQPQPGSTNGRAVALVEGAAVLAAI